ncbi:alpha/beta fold hydrolase [Arenimonas alkanexedens]
MKRRTLFRASALLVLLAGIVALASVWEPDRSVESLTPKWAPPPSQFIALDGMQVHLRDEGPRDDDEPILLLHGTSASLHTWDGWVEDLAQDRRVIRVDLPGFGLTGPDPASRYDVASYARFVVGVMDQLQVERVVLAGNSLGGQIAWKTAHDHPARVSKLILVDAAGYAYEPESVPVGFRLARNPLFAPLLTRILPRSTVAASLRDVYGDPARVNEALVDRYFELTLRAGNRGAIAERFEQMPLDAHEDEIRDVKQATLVLWGGKDRLIPLKFGERFARDLPDAQLVVFDDLGHVPQEEDPVATVRAARTFLAETLSPRDTSDSGRLEKP